MGNKTKPKKGKKKVVIIVLVVLVVVAAIIGSSVKKMTSQVATAVNTVEVEPVQKRDLSDTISLKGTVSGITKNNATSKALAEITAVNVQVGDIVKEGDVLCTLDSSTIQDQIADLEKNMSDTNATDSINSQQTAETVSRAKEDQQTQLAAAQKAIDDAKDAYNAQSIMWDKSEDKSDAEFQSLLAAQKAVTTAEEDYQKVLETTNRTIEDAQRAVELDKYKGSDSSSKDKLTDLKEQLEDCNITAPCGGVVTAVNVSVGDVNADSKTPLVTIEDTSSLKMVATVEEADILKIEEGMKATVTADAMGDETINGTVTRVVRVKGQSTGSDGQTTSGGYSVEISLDNKELLVGMEVKAKVMIKEKGEVLAIPYDLVKTDDDGNTYVLVAEANADGSATAVKKNITVGEEVDYYTEVTGGDLAEGEDIRSARFLGDIGYFVTFRNTDPLFSVDLSDPSDPKILGELKITGFSSYLHFYGENKLLGVGNEVDPETGAYTGIKLAMFDLSDPSNVKQLHKFVIKDTYDCPLFYNYKAAMIDTEKNVFGFMCDSSYMVFCYDEEKGFENVFTENLGDSYYGYSYNGLQEVRGCFIGDNFYLVGGGQIRIYDMANDYKEVGRLEL